MKTRILPTTRLSFPLASAIAALLAAPVAYATSDSWKADAAGNWNATGSWTGGNIPGSTTATNADVATFSFSLTAARAVTVDTTRFIGGITFENTSTNAYTLSGGTLNLNNGGVIQTLAGNGNHIDKITAKILLTGATATFTANATSPTSTMELGANASGWLLGNATSNTVLTLNGSNTGKNVVGSQSTGSTTAIDDGSGRLLSMVKDGPGTWWLSGKNNADGGLTIKAGTLVFAQRDGAVGTGGPFILGDSAGGANAATVVSGSMSATAGVGLNMSRPVTLAATTTGILTLGGGAGIAATTYSGGVTGANNLTLDSRGTLLTMSNATINNTGTLTVKGAGNTAIDSVIGANVTSLTKIDVGTLTLSAANAHSGTTTVSGGTLTLTNALALRNSTLVTTGAGTVTLVGVTTPTFGGLSGATGDLATVISSGYSGVTALTLNPGTGVTNNYAGSIADGAVGMTLSKTGLGTQVLSGANNYGGATTITAGTLALGANDVLPATAVSIGSATLDVATFTDTVGTLDATGSAVINVGTGGQLACADCSSLTWAGTLNITGTFVSGASLRFGSSNTGLTETQLAKITRTGLSNFGLDENGFLTASADTTPPLLTGIVDNKDGGAIPVNTMVTFTVTFNEPIKASTVDAADFDNAGTASVTIGAVTAISATVFTVQVTPTGTGTLRLQLPTTATITDPVDNALITTPPLADDTLISVNDTPAPTLAASSIVDDKTGELVAPNMVVTYTVTFSEDMDDPSVSDADFGNAGTATVTIGTVTETAPGVFSVPVTPTSTGTLQLKVNANAVLRAAASGNVMDMTSAILDDTTLTVGTYIIWDTVSDNGATIDPGSGDWNTTAGNAFWNNVGVNEVWSQTGTTVPLKDAVFAGVDGTVESYVVTLDAGSQIAAKTLNFRNTGYNITGGTVYLPVPTPNTTPTITVAADKSATINSAIKYATNTVVYTTVGAGGTLNLGGGYPAGTNPQPRWNGAGTINMTAGSFVSNSTILNAAEMNQLPGTTVSTPYQIWINNNAGRDASYTLSGGTMSLNAPDSNRTFGLVLGSASGNYIGKFTVKSAATVNIGTTASNYGHLAVVGVNGDGRGALEVQDGTVTIGNSQASNQIYLFKDGANPGKSATMTQSGGTVTTPGIQFGNTTGTYAASASATLQLSGGYLFVGSLGITRGSAATDLPITIQLAGGTLAASGANWASSLDIKLGTTGGGVTFQAADSGGTARNITLSGSLSDDGAVNGGFKKTGLGTLTLSGANTYSGNTTVNAGTLTLSNAPDPDNANPGNDASTVTIAAGATLNLTYPGTDKVDELFIGTTQKAAGVYGKVGSTSPIISIPQITGDGTLTVASGSAGFSSWITGTFANGIVPLGKQGPNDDPDHDGIPNLVEYAIADQDPTVGNATIGSFIYGIILGFPKREGTNGLTYAIVESTDLGLTDDWTEVSGGSYVNSPTTIAYTLTPGTPVKNFVRLKVTQAP